MDDKQINAVVDNLAAKLGVAADKLVPITETMVREVTVTGWFLGVAMSLLIALTAIAAITILVRRPLRCISDDYSRTKDGLTDVPSVIVGIILLGAMFLMTIPACQFYVQALSPTLTLLERIAK